MSEHCYGQAAISLKNCKSVPLRFNWNLNHRPMEIISSSEISYLSMDIVVIMVMHVEVQLIVSLVHTIKFHTLAFFSSIFTLMWSPCVTSILFLLFGQWIGKVNSTFWDINEILMQDSPKLNLMIVWQKNMRPEILEEE